MNIYTSIDIGTENIKILSMRKSSQDNSFIVIAKSSYSSNGIKYGYIANSDLFLVSLKKALLNFSKENRIIIDEAFFSLSGFGLRSEKISIEQPTPNGIISESDLEKSEEKALYTVKKNIQNKIIDKKIIKYLINGFEHFSNPLELSARKFTTDFLFITYPKNNLTILEEVISEAGISVISFTPALISSGEISLSNLDKKLGCALVDIGDQTTSVIVYENNLPIHYFILKIGSKNITDKISLSEKIDFTKADKIKKAKINNKKIEKIIKDYLKLIAEKINNEIKTGGNNTILPGGITITGGGSRIPHIEEIFKKEISLPIKKSIKNIQDSKTDYHVCYGNIILGLEEENNVPKIKIPNPILLIKSLIKKVIKKFYL